uniref:Uncharacterized protein n=1 Tax=Sinocyclocheilus anshuiensis TaxID=1608454 RepID=A0A671L2K6_9TELE
LLCEQVASAHVLGSQTLTDGMECAGGTRVPGLRWVAVTHLWWHSPMVLIHCSWVQFSHCSRQCWWLCLWGWTAKIVKHLYPEGYFTLNCKSV